MSPEEVLEAVVVFAIVKGTIVVLGLILQPNVENGEAEVKFAAERHTHEGENDKSLG